jgi:hypothetical protein
LYDRKEFQMNCKIAGCRGKISDIPSVSLQTSCISAALANACNACGRLYWPNGNPIFNRQGHAAFLEGGNVVNRNEEGMEMSRF